MACAVAHGAEIVPHYTAIKLTNHFPWTRAGALACPPKPWRRWAGGGSPSFGRDALCASQIRPKRVRLTRESDRVGGLGITIRQARPPSLRLRGVALTPGVRPLALSGSRRSSTLPGSRFLRAFGRWMWGITTNQEACLIGGPRLLARPPSVHSIRPQRLGATERTRRRDPPSPRLILCRGLGGEIDHPAHGQS
jgi:hypothetical protein